MRLYTKVSVAALGTTAVYFLLKAFPVGRKMARNGNLEMVGFPEFWQKAHDLKPAAFASTLDVQRVSNQLFKKAISEPLHKVVRAIAKSTVNSLGALTTLLLNGYGNDAMKVARGMFENSVIVLYLIRHPELLDDYFDYDHIKTKKQLDYLDNYDPDLVKGLPAVRRAEIESNYQSVKAKFTDSKGRLRGSWSKASIREMATEVGLEEHYLTFYSWAASMHHMDIRGVTLHADNAVLDTDVAPSLRWIPEALISGHQAALIVLAEYNAVGGHGMDGEIDRLKASFLEVWKV